MTYQVPPAQQLPYIFLPQLGVQPEFWSSVGCPDPTISPVCLWHWNKEVRHEERLQNSPFSQVVEIQKNLKHVRMYHRAATQTLNFVSQTKKEQRCCKKISVKSLKLTWKYFKLHYKKGIIFSIWKKNKQKESCFNFKLNWFHALFYLSKWHIKK